MPVPVAFLDANVLYPAELRSFLMYLALAGTFQARWSNDVHEEWISNLLANRPDLNRTQLERTRQLMDAHAPGSLVTGFEYRMEGLTLPDPDDRHVLAAAIHGKASVIITNNLKDFPEPSASGARSPRPSTRRLCEDPAYGRPGCRAERCRGSSHEPEESAEDH